MPPTIDRETPLGAIATEHPRATRELELLALDYCCGGQRTLAEACLGTGLDPDAIAASLNALDEERPAADWSTLSVAELVDHIEATHHEYLHAELPRLAALADKVATAHSTRHPELRVVRDLLGELSDDLVPHLLREERVLFPMIRVLESSDAAPRFHCGTLRNPISVMLADHDRAGTLLHAMRNTTGGYDVPDDGCATYRAFYEGLAELETDTHLHIHKENNVLFPAVLDLEAARAHATSP